jgi:hypothetical protein
MNDLLEFALEALHTLFNKRDHESKRSSPMWDTGPRYDQLHLAITV